MRPSIYCTRPWQVQRTTTPTASRSCPSSALPCRPGSSGPGRWPTWTRPSRPTVRPLPPSPATTRTARGPVHPQQCPVLPVRAVRGAGRPGRRHHHQPSGRRPHPQRPPRQRSVPVQPRPCAAGPVRAIRDGGRPGGGHHHRPPGRERHPRRPPGTRGFTYPTSAAALQVPVRAVRGGWPTWRRPSPPAARPSPLTPAATPTARGTSFQPRPCAAGPVRAVRDGGRPGGGHHHRPHRPLTPSPADHPDRALYLSNLGAALDARFKQFGSAS